MYRDDLAYIHDQGYAHDSERAATFIVRLLRANGLPRGRLLELGCGSGRSTARLMQAGYEVFGMDISSAMLRLARRRVPEGTFRIGSFPIHANTCWNAVVAIGEVVNYLPSVMALRRMIRLVFRSLQPGGFFIFDMRRLPQKGDPIRWLAGKGGTDWAVTAGSVVDLKQQRLTRRILTLRFVRGRWRARTEVHHQRLYRVSDMDQWLRAAGFDVEVRKGYGRISLPAGKLFIARKPPASREATLSRS